MASGGSLSSSPPFTKEELRPLAILEGLPDADLEWFCEHATRVRLQKGEHMFHRGEPADALWLVVEGEIQGFEEVGGQWLLVATTRRGDVTGMLPFSRMTHYPRNTVAAEASEVLRLAAELFPELIYLSHEMGRRLVARMSDRVRGDVRLEQQGEKMMALGRLSAGLAHELNNPAAAVRRDAVRLGEHQERLSDLALALVRHHPDEGALALLESMRALGSREPDPNASSLDRGLREEELLQWLESRGVEQAWDVAAGLAGVGVKPAELEELAKALPSGALSDALLWLSSGIDSDVIVRDIDRASGRISALISSIKTYSHMDRSPAHKPTDVRVGIDNTLTMLSHKLKQKSIRVDRQYEPDLPTVPANEGELNQVWTNLIDNAIDAMQDRGLLVARARSNHMWVEVEIEDDGEGIPENIRARIFEPFFTTKEVGEGTGLGLDIAQRIVHTHQGHIDVRSQPGETVMCVRLSKKAAAP